MAALCIVVLLAVFFNPLVRSGATFSTVSNLQQNYYPWYDTARLTDARLPPQLDQADYVYPRQVFLDAAIKKGDGIPSWNPLTLSGTPFLAQSGSRLGYPPFVALTGLLSPSWAHDVYIVLHLLGAGLAMFALMKHFGTRFAGALLASVSWAFSSYVMGWVMLEMVAAVAALLPLAILFVRRWHDRGRINDLLAGGLVLGLLILGSSVEFALLSFVVVVLYAAALAVNRVVRNRGGSPAARWQQLAVLAQPAVLGAVALAVAAVALVPFLVLSARSGRIPVSIDDQLDALSVPVRSFLHVFWPPSVPRDVTKSITALSNEQVFVGSMTALLAIVGLGVRRAGAGLGRAMAIVVFALATGSPVAWAAYHAVPFLARLNGFGRMLFLFDFGVAILGGLGLDAVLRWMRSRPRAFVGALAVICMAVTAGQLLVYGRHVNTPFQPREGAQLYPSTPAVEATRDVIGRQAGRNRAVPLAPVAGPHELVPATPMALDLPAASAYEPVLPERISTLWRVVEGESVASALNNRLIGTFATRFSAGVVRTDLLGRVGVGAVLAPPGDVLGPGWNDRALAARGLRRGYSGPDGVVFAVVDRPARALVVPNAKWVASPGEALRSFADPAFDVRGNVILEGDPAYIEPTPPSRPPNANASRVRWIHDGPDELRLTVTTDATGWLLVLDSWDPGWHATVNGRATPVVHADYTFRAVRVPRGTSTVRFSYRPKEVVAGAVVSATSAGLVVTVLVVLWLTRRRRRAGRQPLAAPLP